MSSHPDLALLRLVAQRLAGPRHNAPLDAVRHLGAVQAQDLPGSLTSVALRVDGGSKADVAAALNSAQVVRSWPMRGTLHLVPAEDLRWMLSVTAARMLAGAAGRRADLGITEAVIEQAREIALAELNDRGRLRRTQLFEVWAAERLLGQPQTGIHLLGRLCQEATLVLGPLEGAEQLVVAHDDWVPTPRELSREDGLVELTRRYLHSHGPATVADLARWASLTLTEARAGVDAVRSELATIDIDGVEHLLDPALPDLLAEYRSDARRLRLLPGFDEFILGYADRRFAVPPAFAERIVPGNNGMFRPTIVKAGRVIGTWKRSGSPAKPRIQPEPFRVLSARDQASIETRFAELSRSD